MAVPVAEVAEQLQRLGQAGGGGRVVPGPPLHHAQLFEGPGLAAPVAEVAEQLQRPGQAGGGGRVVPGQPLHHAQLVEGPGLAVPVAEVAEQLQRLGQAGGGGRVVPGQLLNNAQLVAGPGLALPVADRARSGQGGLAESDSLVPVALDVQEVAHRNGNPDGVHKTPVGCGVVDTGVQVGAFGAQPGDRLFFRAQFWGPGRRSARRRRAGDGGTPGDVPAGGHGGVQVVVQQPVDRGLLFRGVVGGGKSPGMLAEQVVEAVPAAGRFADQVLVVQLAEAPPGGMQVGAVQGRGGVGVDLGAGVQAESAEQALLDTA